MPFGRASGCQPGALLRFVSLSLPPVVPAIRGAPTITPGFADSQEALGQDAAVCGSGGAGSPRHSGPTSLLHPSSAGIFIATFQPTGRGPPGRTLPSESTVAPTTDEAPVSATEPRRRSVGFIDRDGRTWACFLVTFPTHGGRWKGHFAFRPSEARGQEDLVRTADIFVEDSETEIDRKARGLGRPLLSGLLASALHMQERESREPAAVRGWFRRMLRDNSRELAGEWEETPPPEGDEAAEDLESIYQSYRIDQVAHLIALLDPHDFQAAVDRILDGRTFDFGARDRLQFAMMVVEYIEGLLPLPPFDVWARDYLAHPEEYRIYTHQLHREGVLP
jgi:hypothetical protein